MTGWRIGFAIGPKWIMELCEKYQGQITSGASNISQRAALTAVSSDLGPTHAMRDSFRQRRNFVFEQLSSIEDIKTFLPEGAFYFYPDVSGFFGKKTAAGTPIHNIDDFCAALLDEGLVAVITGEAFGTDKHIRISYAYSMETLQKALSRLTEFCAGIQ